MASNSGQDLIKFMTAEVVKYMEMPREERKKMRIFRKEQTPWHEEWFGLLPASLKMWSSRYVNKIKKRP